MPLPLVVLVGEGDAKWRSLIMIALYEYLYFSYDTRHLIFVQ